MERYENMMYKRIKLVSETGFSVEIGEDLNDYVLDENGLDLGTVGSTQNMTQYIDLIGKHLDSVVLEPRDISITGWIIGDSEKQIQGRKVLLNKLVNPMYECRLEYGEYVLNFRPDSSIRYATTWKENSAWMCKFQIQGTAPMPLWMLKDYNVYGQTVELVSKTHFPMVIPKNKGMHFGYYPMNSISRMPNFGDVESGFILRYTFEGDVTNPKIINLKTGDKIEFIKKFENGEQIEICTELGNQYAKWTSQGVVRNALKYLSSDSKVDMSLSLWLNNLDVDADEGVDNIQALLSFSPRFLEVEGR